MIQPRRSPVVALAAAALFVTFACGGGDSPSEPTDKPPAVASVEVSPADATLEIGEALQLSAVTRDAQGNVLTGRAVAWASGDTDVATVSGSGMVAAVGPGSADITATSEGRSGAATVVVELTAFQPTTDTEIGGTRVYASVEIPEGVTVSVTSDLVLEVRDEVVIAGTLEGGCVGLDVSGGGAVEITGTVRSACGEEVVDVPALRIVADGELRLEDAVIEVAGDVELKNDPTLTDQDFPEPSPSGPEPSPARQTGVGGCVISNTSITARPKLRTPATRREGVDGRNGRLFDVACRGDLLVSGARIEGQDGQDGGDGEDLNRSVDAEASGGDGGRGGLLRVRATGDIAVTGADQSVFASGAGGHGGSAEATTVQEGVPSRAPSASARGGNGGDSGLIKILAGGTLQIGNLRLEIGDGGTGGDATATGADGVDASDRDGPAQSGGHATADGGDGGESPDKDLGSAGAVSGLPQVIGGHGGQGGEAVARAGKGGVGDETDPAGAPGGNVHAQGGNGGDAMLRDGASELTGDGGDGGRATLGGGSGGDGWDDCGEEAKPGGAGGAGGDATGGDGAGGSGRTNGQAPGVVVDGVGNGGEGGDGEGPGEGGGAGTDGIQAQGGRTLNGTNFQSGANGSACGAATPKLVYVRQGKALVAVDIPPIVCAPAMDSDEHCVGEGETLLEEGDQFYERLFPGPDRTIYFGSIGSTTSEFKIRALNGSVRNVVNGANVNITPGTILRNALASGGCCSPAAQSSNEYFVLFARPDENGETGFDLYRANPDGSDVTRLTSLEGQESFPFGAPSGDFIVFQQRYFDPSVGTASDILRMDPDGSNIVRLTDDPRRDERPAVSPDGERIAFTSNRDEVAREALFVMNADGSERRRITPLELDTREPWWLPDGRIVFSGRPGGSPMTFDLYVVDPDDGSAPIQLTDTPDINERYPIVW